MPLARPPAIALTTALACLTLVLVLARVANVHLGADAAGIAVPLAVCGFAIGILDLSLPFLELSNLFEHPERLRARPQRADLSRELVHALSPVTLSFLFVHELFRRRGEVQVPAPLQRGRRGHVLSRGHVGAAEHVVGHVEGRVELDGFSKGLDGVSEGFVAEVRYSSVIRHHGPFPRDIEELGLLTLGKR